MEVINYKGNNYKSGATLDEDINFTDYSGEFELIEGEIDDYIFEYQRFSGGYSLPIPLTFIRLSNKKFKFYFNKVYEEFVNANITSYSIEIFSQNNKKIFTINFKLKGFEEQVDNFSYDIYYRPFYFNGALLMSRHDLKDYNDFISGNTIMDENTEYCELFYSIANGCSYKQDSVYKLGEVKLQLNDNILTIKEPFRPFNELDFNSSGKTEIDVVSAVYGIREPYLSNDFKNINEAYALLTGNTKYDDYRDISEKHGIIFYLNETGVTNTNITLNPPQEFTNKDNAILNEFAYFTKGPVQVMSDDKIVMKTIPSNFNATLLVSEKEIMGYESFSETISSTVANVFFPKTITYSFDNDSENYKLTNNLDVYGAKFFRLGSYSMSDVIQSLRYTTYNNKKEQYDGLSCRNDFRTQNESGAGGKEGWDSIFTVVANNEDGTEGDMHLTSGRLIKYNDFLDENSKTKFIMAIYDIYTENYNDVVIYNEVKKENDIQWQVKNDLTPKDTSRFSVIKIYKGREYENQIIFE